MQIIRKFCHPSRKLIPDSNKVIESFSLNGHPFQKEDGAKPAEPSF